MANNGNRSFRRDQPAAQSHVSDPLAELARLIGQSDPRGGAKRSSETYDNAPPDTELDWASADDVQYADEHRDDDWGDHGRDGDYDRSRDEDGSDRRYAAAPPAPRFADPRGDSRDSSGLHEAASGVDEGAADPHYANEGPRSARSPSFYPNPPDDFRRPGYGHYGPEDHGGQVDEQEEEPPRRRRAAFAIIAILGLTVLGTAGALGYRALFGGSVVPALPPIIKPADGPIKVEPKHEAQATGTNPSDAASHGTAEQLVAHQEQPVDLPPANPTPRVVTTIPVIPNTVDGVAGGQPPAPPSALPADASASALPDQMSAPPPRAATAPHEVRTIAVKPNSPPAVKPSPALASGAASPPHNLVRPARPAPAPLSGGPLSIVPSQVAMQPSPAPRSLHPEHGESASPPPGEGHAASGSYAVQVSSQRSEAEAQAAFRALQARFPQQLGGRHATVRRADLGAKGVYYRALVGPFASAEQAASLCSSLKAAGGNCLIQRN